MKTESLHIEYISVQKGTCERNRETHIKTLPWLSVVASIKGQYGIALDGAQEMRTEEGGCFIAPAGILQNIVHYTPVDGHMQMQWVFIDARVNEIYKLEDLYAFPTVLSAGESKAFILLMDRLLNLQTDSITDNIGRQKLGFAILEVLMKYSIPKEHLDADIMPAIQKIRGGYSEQISVEQLAQNCHLSVSTFLRKFKKATDLPPIAYIGQLRLSVASSLLITTSLSVALIAERTGFYDQFYFSRSFKQKYGISPTEYRKMLTNS